jgi:nucleotide-binding universal stress UspA family protein
MQELLVAFDDSDAARAALAWAIQYAQASDARVVLLYVVSSVGEWELAAVQVNTDPLRQRFGELLDGIWSEPLREANVPYRTKMVVGRPAEKILETARGERVSLIVLGMTARGILHELVLGTTARHVLHEAQRPVVAVPGGWVPDGSQTAS